MTDDDTATWTDGTTFKAEVARALIDKLRARDRAQRAIIARLRDAEQTRAPQTDRHVCMPVMMSDSTSVRGTTTHHVNTDDDVTRRGKGRHRPPAPAPT